MVSQDYEDEKRRWRVAHGLSPEPEAGGLREFLGERLGTGQVPVPGGISTVQQLERADLPERTKRIYAEQFALQDQPGVLEQLGDVAGAVPGVARRFLFPTGEEARQDIGLLGSVAAALGASFAGPIAARMPGLPQNIREFGQREQEAQFRFSQEHPGITALGLAVPPGAMATGGLPALGRELRAGAAATKEGVRRVAPAARRLATEEAGFARLGATPEEVPPKVAATLRAIPAQNRAAQIRAVESGPLSAEQKAARIKILQEEGPSAEIAAGQAEFPITETGAPVTERVRPVREAMVPSRQVAAPGVEPPLSLQEFSSQVTRGKRYAMEINFQGRDVTPKALANRNFTDLERVQEAYKKYLAGETGEPLPVTLADLRAGRVAEPIAPAAAVPARGVVAEAVEPWQMTKEEFNAVPRSRADGSAWFGASEAQAQAAARWDAERIRLYGRRTGAEIISLGDKYGRYAEHHEVVKAALAEGKSVPANVLADYPDLAPSVAKVPTTAVPARGAVPEVTTPTAATQGARAAVPAGPAATSPLAPLTRAGEIPPVPPVRPPVATGAVPEPLPSGQPGRTLQDADDAIKRFAQWLGSPESQNAWDLTLQMRKEALGQRVARLEARAQELVVEGKAAEEAMQQAVQETMSGRLPSVTTDLTTEFRDALFAKVYHTLQEEPLEMMSTAEALRHALAGRPVPRIPGTAGGSAYSRLQRVFGENPVVLEQLAKGEKIEETVERALLASAPKPIGVDRALADYLESLPTIPHGQARLGETPYVLRELPPLDSPLHRAESLVATIRATYPDIRDLPVAQREALLQELRATGVGEADFGRLQLEMFPGTSPIPIKAYEPSIEQAIKVPHLMPPQAQHLIIRSLKEAGWTVVDIGNFLRANKASFDFSFWRQQAPLILNHKRDFVTANIEAWRALWSKDAAGASWKRIQNDSLYPLYEELGLDFLRPLELPKGAPRYKGVEEFGFLQSDRPIPKFTGKLPWVKLSQRAFVTGTNEHNWRIFKGFYRDMLKVNERIASGRVALKEGQAFSIRKNMQDFGKLLEDFSGRASLGKGRELAPVLSGLLFAPRFALGRLLSPRRLFSSNPYVRKEAWKDAVTFVGGFGSILVLGQELKLWHVELDPRSSDFAKIRIGNTRIDPWGGYQQFVRLFVQIATNSGVAIGTGEVYKQDPLAAITRFLRGKAAPLPSMVADFKTGKTYVGDDVNLTSPKQWIDKVSPLLPMDIYEAFEEGGLGRAGAVALPGAVGAGVSTFGKAPVSWKEDLRPYFAISSNPITAERESKTTREEYRKDNPEVDAKLFLTGGGGVDSVLTTDALTAAVRLMKEHGIAVEDIKSLKFKEDEAPVRKKWRERFEQEMGVMPKVTTVPTPSGRPGTTPLRKISKADKRWRIAKGLSAERPTPVPAGAR